MSKNDVCQSCCEFLYQCELSIFRTLIVLSRLNELLVGVFHILQNCALVKEINGFYECIVVFVRTRF